MTQKTQITRRRFLKLGAYALAPYGLAFFDGFFIERQWLRLSHIRLSSNPTCRIAHFTDVHHKGDMAYFRKIIAKINALQPNFVCFTGDLIEEASYLKEAISCLQEIKYPLFAIPGNHDYWSRISFTALEECCKKTGGAWLMDQEALSPDGKTAIFGSAGQNPPPCAP